MLFFVLELHIPCLQICLLFGCLNDWVFTKLTLFQAQKNFFYVFAYFCFFFFSSFLLVGRCVVHFAFLQNVFFESRSRSSFIGSPMFAEHAIFRMLTILTQVQRRKMNVFNVCENVFFDDLILAKYLKILMQNMTNYESLKIKLKKPALFITHTVRIK